MQLNTVHMVNDNIERKREIEEYVCKKEIYGCKMVDKGETIVVLIFLLSFVLSP